MTKAPSHDCTAYADDNRRLRAVNAELREALQDMMDVAVAIHKTHYGKDPGNQGVFGRARAALRKAGVLGE